MPLPYGEAQAKKQMLLGDPEHELLFALLDTVGDGSGTKNMATTADVYLTKAPTNEIYVIDHITIGILDDSAIDVDGWGGIAALTTGCLFTIQREEGASAAYDIFDFTGGETLKDHIQLGRLGEMNFISDATGCFVQLHMALGAPIRLDGDKGEAIVFEVQDNLSTLVRQEVAITGRRFLGKLG